MHLKEGFNLLKWIFMFKFHLTSVNTNSVIPDSVVMQFWPYEVQKAVLINTRTSLKDFLNHRQFYTL
jgi:hypothetical protein